MPHIRTVSHGAPRDSGELRNPHALCPGRAAAQAAASARTNAAASRTIACDDTGRGGLSRRLGFLLGPLVCTAGLAVALASLLTGCGDNTPPGEVATMRACRICHGTDRICADIGRLDRAGWEKTVDRMIAGGASVTPEERTAVIDWLATRKPGEAPLCP